MVVEVILVEVPPLILDPSYLMILELILEPGEVKQVVVYPITI